MLTAGQEALDHRLTHRDLDDVPDDGNRYEIIDGEIYVSPFPTYAHQHAATQLTTTLNNYVREKNLGRVFAAGLKVVLGDPTGVGPDLVFIASSRMDGMKDDGYYGAPDLLVEVLSSKPQLDRYIKLNKYAQAGVAHYWIVDPKARTLSSYRLDGSRYRLVGEYEGDALFKPQLFDGLTIDLAELWV